MNILRLCPIFLLTALNVFGQQHFKANALKRDLDSMVYYIEAAHPNPYYRYSRLNFHNDVEKAKQHLAEGMDYTSFYLVAQKLVAKLQDGHIDLEMPLKQFEKDKANAFPFKVALNINKPYIRLQENVKLKHGGLNKNAEIISINGINAKKIVDDIVALVKGETADFRASYGSKSFDFYYDVLYPKKGFYELTYNDKGKMGTVKVSPKDIIQTDKHRTSIAKPERTIAPFTLTFPLAGTALMKLDDFQDLEKIKVFADSAFSDLNNKKTANLIIDLRGNLGGDSDVGDYLLQYLLNKPFRQYDRVLEKNSQLLKNRLLAHRTGKTLSAEDSTLLLKPNGMLDTVKNQNEEILQLPNRFSGKVYLLVSNQTFSSAADFAQAFSHYKRGKVIGEETGGMILSFGDIVPATLPETKLPLVVSSKLYLNIGADEHDWHGVIPDINCSRDEALQKALGLIGHVTKSRR
ncbi:S41 family peptidase [Pedobacter sp. 22226]|uniref:S41 family peptidase n=1 Tax=Pedobacter sp. 22226 TaxID=3453894 RepID=UPI003F86A2C6